MPLTCDKPEAFFIRTRERITYYNKVQEKNGWIRMCSSEGSFAGVYQWDEKRNRYFPVKMF